MEEQNKKEALINYLQEINKNSIPVPMPEEEINQLSFSKYRTFNGETMALPYSLQVMLSYDKDFMAVPNCKLLSPLFEALDNKTGIIHSTNLDLFFQNNYPEMEGLKWNAFENAPALIQLNTMGDQLIFLYVIEPEAQEYPICRLDPSEFCLWLTGINIVHHLIQIIEGDNEYDEYLEKLEENYEDILSNEYYLYDCAEEE